ncbi:MAG: diguanylate cyclase [Campylobacterota bacterium]|nr:diguanylate cyclase [Campylobacterota bacterium]
MKWLFLHCILLTLYLDATTVSLTLPWRHQFQFAGYYLAKEKGFYADVGLDVVIDEYEPSRDNTNEVLKGSYDFGIGHSSLILDAINHKDSIVIMAAIHQSSPLILLSKKRKDLTKLSDFKDKVIMMSADQSYTASINAMLMSSGLKLDSFKIVPTSFEPIDLINGYADMMTAYISNEPYTLKEKGIEYTIFDPKEYNFDFYSDILFTSHEFLQMHPDHVKSFYEASIKGWRYAYANMQESAQLIFDKYNTQNRSLDALLYEAKTLKNLAFKDQIPFGNIDVLRLREITNTFRLLGLVKTDNPDFNHAIYSPYQGSSIVLNDQHREFLIAHDTLRVCVIQNNLPLEDVQHNQFIGLSADVLSFINQTLQENIIPVATHSIKESLMLLETKQCDIISGVQPQFLKDHNDLLHTKAYADIPQYLITHTDTPFNSVTQLLHEKIGVESSEYPKELFKNIVTIASLKEGLSKVSNREIFGVISDLVSLKHLMETQTMSAYNILALDEDIPLCFAVHKESALLHDILNLHVSHLPANEINALVSKWLRIEYVKAFDYRFVWILLSVILFLLGMSYLIYLRLNRLLEQKNSTLKQQLQIFDENICASHTDKKGVINYVSEAFCKSTGYSKKELLGKTHRVIKHPNSSMAQFDDMWMSIASGHAWRDAIQNRNKDGSDIWFDTLISPTFDKRGKITGYKSIRHDITHKKMLEHYNVDLEYEVQQQTQTLEEQRQYLDTLFDINPNIAYVTDGHSIKHVNKAFLNFTECKTLELFLEKYECFCEWFMEADGYCKPKKDAKLGYAYTEHNQKSSKVLIEKDNQKYIFNLNAKPFYLEEKKHYLITLEDITKLEHQATRDALTGLLNRKQLDESLEYLIAKFNRYEHVFCVILIDIDFFKQVNDNYGHQMGDEVLKKISKLLQLRLRESDTLGRWGGEEFMILTASTHIKGAMTLCESIRLDIQKEDFGLKKALSVSIGVAEFDKSLDEKSIIHKADEALYKAKEEGRNRIVQA